MEDLKKLLEKHYHVNQQSETVSDNSRMSPVMNQQMAKDSGLTSIQGPLAGLLPVQGVLPSDINSSMKPDNSHNAI